MFTFALLCILELSLSLSLPHLPVSPSLFWAYLFLAFNQFFSLDLVCFHLHFSVFVCIVSCDQLKLNLLQNDLIIFLPLHHLSLTFFLYPGQWRYPWSWPIIRSHIHSFEMFLSCHTNPLIGLQTFSLSLPHFRHVSYLLKSQWQLLVEDHIESAWFEKKYV